MANKGMPIMTTSITENQINSLDILHENNPPQPPLKHAKELWNSDYKDLNNLCRGCLTIENVGVLQDLNCADPQLVELYEHLTQIKINLADIPAKMCPDCILQLTKTNEFINKLKYSYELLEKAAQDIKHLNSSSIVEQDNYNFESTKILQNVRKQKNSSETNKDNLNNLGKQTMKLDEEYISDTEMFDNLSVHNADSSTEDEIPLAERFRLNLNKLNTSTKRKNVKNTHKKGKKRGRKSKENLENVPENDNSQPDNQNSENTCSICSKQVRNLTKHLETSHSIDWIKLKCLKCLYQNDDRELLIEHWLDCHVEQDLLTSNKNLDDTEAFKLELKDEIRDCDMDYDPDNQNREDSKDLDDNLNEDNEQHNGKKKRGRPPKNNHQNHEFDCNKCEEGYRTYEEIESHFKASNYDFDELGIKMHVEYEDSEIINNDIGNYSYKSSPTPEDEVRNKDYIYENLLSSIRETPSELDKYQFFKLERLDEEEVQSSNELSIQSEKNLSVIRNTRSHDNETNNANQSTVFERIQRKIQSTKKEARCKFCSKDLMSKNYVRHMETYHRNETEVKKILRLPIKSKERREAFTLLRHDANFELFLTGVIRPNRKTDELEPKSTFYPCIYCKGLFKKNYLRRHSVLCRKKQLVKDNKPKNYLSDSQTITACAIDPTNVISKMNVKEQVFKIMKGDDIAFEAKKDLLIAHFGESYLEQHNHDRKEYACSNRMREMSRFLIAFREITQNTTISLKEALVPKNFDYILAATRQISGYDPNNKVFLTPSLAMHMGTYLKAVCDELSHLILRESPGFTCESKVEKQIWHQEVKNLKELLATRWNTEITSFANKDMQEKRWDKPLLVPLVSDLKIFRDSVLEIASRCANKFHDYEDNIDTYELLVNCTLSLLILFNRRPISDVQCLKIEDYSKVSSSNFNDFENALTDFERALTQRYERVLSSGKGSKAVLILVPEIVQEFIGVLLQYREKYFSVDSEYIFALPHSKIECGRGDEAIRKLASNFDLQRPDALTSNKLRQHIAIVTQILSLSKEESKEFSKLVGHTEETHAEFDELAVDIYQTAKVSKFLLLMEKGKLPIEYKGKPLDEIEIDIEFPEEDYDSAAQIESCKKYEGSDSDDALTKTKETIKVQKKGWSRYEVDLLTSTFEDYIKNGLYPNSRTIQEFASKNGIDRSSVVIKAKLQHIMKLRKSRNLDGIMFQSVY